MQALRNWFGTCVYELPAKIPISFRPKSHVCFYPLTWGQEWRLWELRISFLKCNIKTSTHPSSLSESIVRGSLCQILRLRSCSPSFFMASVTSVHPFWEKTMFRYLRVKYPLKSYLAGCRVWEGKGNGQAGSFRKLRKMFGRYMDCASNKRHAST